MNNLLSRCRAPIASLDCMEEFSAGSALSALAERGAGEGGITKEQLLLSGLTHSAPSAPHQLARQTSVTPGLRYRNLGKSGLRVSNIGLGSYFIRKQTHYSSTPGSNDPQLFSLFPRNMAHIQSECDGRTGRTDHCSGRGEWN